ncbi:adenylyl-sulfate kinase [Actinokineospora sp.]|uniref:adenylyl-sulfate kinase n=1 Tax=Actinokineospora sp. TaxID=1872133 RepID=UPI004037E0E9
MSDRGQHSSDQVASGPLFHPVVHVVACGSVDDGKSTLIGRLLVETDTVTDDELDYARRVRRGGSTIPTGRVDYSLLTDGLEAELQQGITIDVAYRQLHLPSGRRVILADAPGHEQYTRNMAVAASNANIGILLLDCTKGIRSQTRRHLAVCATMGVRTVLVLVNKLDAVDYRREVFEEQAEQVRAAADRLELKDVVAIPVSALSGDNVAALSDRTPWYRGPSVLRALAEWHPEQASGPHDWGFRLPVQHVTRSADLRGYAGTASGGSVSPGDTVTVARSGAKVTVDRVLGIDGELSRAVAGMPITVTLTDELDIARGDVLIAHSPGTAEGFAPQRATAFAAEVVWTGETPLREGDCYLTVVGPLTVQGTVTAVRGRLDTDSGERSAARTLRINDIGTVEFVTDRPVFLEPYRENRATGSFLFVDRVGRQTVAAGMVRGSLYRTPDIVPQSYSVDQAARARSKGQTPRVLWLTGIPGAGKSTIADALERRLHAMGLHTYVLDGDNVRAGLNKDLGFSRDDRAENVRRVAEAARLLCDAGLIVIVALVSPFRADRMAAKTLFDPGTFVETWVNTSAEVCRSRDPKGLYRKAQAGLISNLTGVGQPYEAPEQADVTVDGSGAIEEIVDQLVRVVISGPE